MIGASSTLGQTQPVLPVHPEKTKQASPQDLRFYDKFWSLLEQLRTPQSCLSGELQDFVQIVHAIYGLEVNDRNASIEKLQSSLSIEQVKELLALTEWAFLLERGCLPQDPFQKDKGMNTDLKKYLGINCYLDILVCDMTLQKDSNGLSFASFCKTWEQQLSSCEHPHSGFETLKQTLIFQCNNLISPERFLITFLNDLKMKETVAYSLQDQIEKTTLEMRVRLALLVSAISHTLAKSLIHESLIHSYASVPKEWHPLLEQLEDRLLELRKNHSHEHFWAIMQFHLNNGYEKIVKEFARACKIDFKNFQMDIPSLKQLFTLDQIQELHHLVEWRYLLLRGITINPTASFEKVKDYLGINCCPDLLTQPIEPKGHYNSISLTHLSEMIAQRASNPNKSLDCLFTNMKNYCLDRIHALLKWEEIAHMLESDLCLDKELIPSYQPLFDQMPLETTLRAVLLIKIARFCHFNNVEKDLKRTPSLPDHLSSIYTLVEICDVNKKQGVYKGKEAPSWTYSLAPHPFEFYRNRDTSVTYYSKLNLPGMPNWMPNRGNSCYMSSSLWSLFFLLDPEIQSQIKGMKSVQETDQRISLAKKALINLYQKVSALEDTIISSTTINSLRALVHDAFPTFFIAPREQEQEDAYHFLICILNLLSLDPFLQTVDISLGEGVKEPRTLSQLLTGERQNIEQAPKYFIGRVARFRADSHHEKEEKKRRDAVIPNATLEFCVKGRENEAVKVSYDLVAITTHRGYTIKGGHYYTYCRKFQNGVWRFYKYDDLKPPSFCEDDGVVMRDVATNGYLFYYKKREAEKAPTQVLFEEAPLEVYATKVFDLEELVSLIFNLTVNAKNSLQFIAPFALTCRKWQQIAYRHPVIAVAQRFSHVSGNFFGPFRNGFIRTSQDDRFTYPEMKIINYVYNRSKNIYSHPKFFENFLTFRADELFKKGKMYKKGNICFSLLHCYPWHVEDLINSQNRELRQAAAEQLKRLLFFIEEPNEKKRLARIKESFSDLYLKGYSVLLDEKLQDKILPLLNALDPKKDRQIILRIMRYYHFCLDRVPEELMRDREIMLALVKEEGLALQHAHASLKGDKEIVLAAVKQNGEAFQYVDESLKQDEEIVRAALKQCGWDLEQEEASPKKDKHVIMMHASQFILFLQHANTTLKRNKDFVLAAVKLNGFALQYVDASLKGDKDIVLTAVKHKGQALQYADASLQRDKDIVLAAIKQNGLALQYADASLKGDKDFMVEAIKACFWCFYYVDASLKKDKEFVMRAIKTAPMCLQYADISLRQDKEIAMTAMKQLGWNLEQTEGDHKQPCARKIYLRLSYRDENLQQNKEIIVNPSTLFSSFFQQADASFKQNKEIFSLVLPTDGLLLHYADESLKQDKKIVLAAIAQDGFALQDADPSLQQDRDVVLAAVKQNGLALQFAHPSLQRDKEIVLAAIGQNALALQCADISLQRDKQIVLAAIKRNGLALQCADASLQRDKEIVLAAVKQNALAFRYADASLQQDKDIIMTVVKANYAKEAIDVAKNLRNTGLSLEVVRKTISTLTS